MQEFIYNIKCIVEYDGSNYSGFQVQKNESTVEKCLTDVISLITKENTKVIGSGRTDKKVHAFGQVINFHTSILIPKDKFMYAINNQLPKDIRIKSLEYVDLFFHSRFSAIKKEYRYYIKTSDFSAFDCNYFDYQKNLDIDILKKALSLFVGKHNFKGFCSVEVDKRKDFVKEIFSATLNQNKNVLEFVFVGTGFLKYQVRRMMALIIEIGKHTEKIEMISEILETKNPLLFTKVANPCGLYLYKVYYLE